MPEAWDAGVLASLPDGGERPTSGRKAGEAARRERSDRRRPLGGSEPPYRVGVKITASRCR